MFGWMVRLGLTPFGMGGAEMYSAAEASFDRALDLNPNLISALADVSTTLTEAGRTDGKLGVRPPFVSVSDNDAADALARLTQSSSQSASHPLGVAEDNPRASLGLQLCRLQRSQGR